MKRNLNILVTIAAALAFAGQSAVAQVPAEPVPAEPPEVLDEAPEAQGESPAPTPESEGRRRAESIERIGSDYSLPDGRRAREVAVIRGKVSIDGTVDRDVVSILGEARLGGAAKVGGDLVVLLGPLEVEPGAVVEGDMVVLGGSMDLPDGFDPGGDLVSISNIEGLAPFASVPPWLSKGFLWGRPIVPEVPWVWAFALVFALIYLAINFVFEGPVRACASELAAKPLSTFLVGVLVLVLLAPVTFVLILSIIGLPMVPFLWMSLGLVALFGRAGVIRWLGARVVPDSAPGDRFEAARSLLVGMLALCLAYMVPVIGLLAWTTVGVFGLGAAATTIFGSLRREHASSSVGEAPEPGEVAEVPVDANGIAEHPVAAFGPRLAAVLVDVALLALLTAILDTRWVVLTALAYHIALWGWKTTTVGGIVCRVRLVRTDGRPPDFSDAFVRGLACILSVAAAGLGWLWILWDANSQSWHDKIAGTYVVRVPPGLPLP